MKHAVMQLIEALHEAERCPRLIVNGKLPEVLIPEHIREDWGECLPIDLDPTYPLNLSADETGFHCCLSFGMPYDCFFPWEAIYVVQDRETQQGMVLEENVPSHLMTREESLVHPATVQPDPDVEPAAEDEEDGAQLSPEERRARFRVIAGGDEEGA